MLQGARAAVIVFAAALAAACSQTGAVATSQPAAAMPAEKTSPPASPVAAAATPSEVAVTDAARTPAAAPSPMPGSGRDPKGCIGSAGYAWSHLLAKCIRVFEAGVRMDPRAKNLDKTQSAFAVMVPGDDSQAELFLPGRAPAILARDGDKQSWRDGAYVLTRAKRTYTLTEANGGARLYEGTAK